MDTDFFRDIFTYEDINCINRWYQEERLNLIYISITDRKLHVSEVTKHEQKGAFWFPLLLGRKFFQLAYIAQPIGNLRFLQFQDAKISPIIDRYKL